MNIQKIWLIFLTTTENGFSAKRCQQKKTLLPAQNSSNFWNQSPLAGDLKIWSCFGVFFIFFPMHKKNKMVYCNIIHFDWLGQQIVWNEFAEERFVMPDSWSDRAESRALRSLRGLAHKDWLLVQTFCGNEFVFSLHCTLSVFFLVGFWLPFCVLSLLLHFIVVMVLGNFPHRSPTETFVVCRSGIPIGSFFCVTALYSFASIAGTVPSSQGLTTRHSHLQPVF